MKTFAQRLFGDETGASMAEYAVLLAIVSVALVAAIGSLTDQIDGTFQRSASGLAVR